MNAMRCPLLMIRAPKIAKKLRLGAGIVAALLALFPLHALAKKSDRDQVMNYNAKSIDAFNAPNTVTTLTGSVKITQGTMLITGDLAKIYLDGQTQIARVIVTGNPAHIQQLDENNNLMTGDAAKLDYDNINGIAVLTTDAVVNQQCRGEFHGDKLTYNTDTSLITGDSSSDGLVHGTILPKSNSPTPTACAKPVTAQPVPANGLPTGQTAEKK